MILLENAAIKLLSAQDAVTVLRDLLKAEDEIDRDREHFFVLHLNTRSVIKTVELISLGSLNTTVASERNVQAGCQCWYL